MRVSRYWAVGLVVVIVGVLVSACGAFESGADVGDLETHNAQLQGTIDAMGTPASTIVALQMTADRGVLAEAELTNLQVTALAAQGTLTAIQLGGAAPAVQTTPPPSNGAGAESPDIEIGAVPAADAQTAFSGTTTSTGVLQSNGCAADQTAVFDVTEDQIYVVTTITNLKAGMVFGASWTVNGELFFDDNRCWVPSQNWDTVCAYCSIIPDDNRFEAGSWTVELSLDGQVLSQVQFQVVDSAQPEAQPAGGGDAAMDEATPADTGDITQ
ncbi:MAG: hypothetical protein JXJ20_09500 [Anaerolineae bacterium]|jgi:hypothetical protein|nr:hypothetical protein [Anaerolineae bacterium]